MKRAFLAVAGFFGLCLSLAAQSPEQFLLDGGTLNRPEVSLANQDRFFFSTAFGAMQPTSEFLPTFSPMGPRSVAAPATRDSKDSFDNIVEFKSTNRIRVGGEVGFLYGKSSGTYGREDFAGYIIGTVGNDTFSITAGYLHQESSGRVPHWRR